MFQSQIGGANNGLIQDLLSLTIMETDPISKDRKKMNDIKKKNWDHLTDVFTSQIIDKERQTAQL